MWQVGPALPAATAVPAERAASTILGQLSIPALLPCHVSKLLSPALPASHSTIVNTAGDPSHGATILYDILEDGTRVHALTLVQSIYAVNGEVGGSASGSSTGGSSALQLHPQLQLLVLAGRRGRRHHPAQPKRHAFVLALALAATARVRLPPES